MNSIFENTVHDKRHKATRVESPSRYNLPSIFADNVDDDITRDSLNPSAYQFPNTTPDSTSQYSATNTLFQVSISDAELLETFTRNPLAKVIVNDVAEDVFDKGFEVEIFDENESADEERDEEDIKLTTEYRRFFDRKIKTQLIRTYKLARLYGWSLLLYGFDDGLPLSEPPSPGSKITFFQPIDKTWVDEIEYRTDDKNNYMLPITILRYKMNDEFVGTKYIHPRRVAHIENPGIDILKEGNSTLESCYDDLIVIKHVVWGAGQTMWRSGNQLVIATAPPRATTPQITAIDNALTNVNTKSAMTFPYGTDVNTNSPHGLNPAPYAEIPMNNISAATRIPISILIGTQAGALASSLTDARDYAGTLSGIQNNTITPILDDIFWYLQKSHQIKYEKFKIVWENPLTMSEPEETLSEYRKAITEERMWDLEQKKKEAGVSTEQQLTSIEQAMKPQEQLPSGVNTVPGELGPGMEIAP